MGDCPPGLEKCQGDYPSILPIDGKLSPSQQYLQHLWCRLHRPLTQPLLVEAAQWMRQHNERVVRYPADIRHRLPARYEWLCADNRRGNATLLKSNSVVHTAR